MQSLPLTHRERPRGAVNLAHLRDIVRRHRFVTYLVVAYAISWSYWIAMVVGGQLVTPGGTTSHHPGLFGPMIAAFVVVTLADGLPGLGDLVGRLFRWRTSARWFALALVPSALFLVGVGLVAATGGQIPTLADLARYSGLPEMALPLVLLLAFAGNGFGEEVGWRGFAQPTLRRNHGFLATSVAVAAAWAIWHVPSFWVIETYRLMGLAIVPVFVIGLGSGAIVFGWLYERSGGSILVVALAHLSLDMSSATAAGRGLPQALVTTGIVAWAALIVAGEVRCSGGLRRAVAGVGRSVMIWLLRSRFGRGLGRTMTIVTYRGRMSGRKLSTPVEYVRSGSQVTIVVASPERKQWWRNVQACGEVSVLLEGSERSGRATVVAPPDAERAVAAYVAERPRAAAVASGAVAVVVELHDAAR